MTSQRAFTLLEALIALGIVSLVVAISLPSLLTLFSRHQDDLVRMQLLQAIHLARQQAIIQGATVALTRDDKSRLQVFVNDEQDGLIHNQNEVLLNQFMRLGFNQLHQRSFPSRLYLLFSSHGGLSSDNASIWYCHVGEKFPVWAILINKSGRARYVLADKQRGIHDGHSNLLRC